MCCGHIRTSTGRLCPWGGAFCQSPCSKKIWFRIKALFVVFCIFRSSPAELPHVIYCLKYVEIYRGSFWRLLLKLMLFSIYCIFARTSKHGGLNINTFSFFAPYIPLRFLPNSIFNVLNFCFKSVQCSLLDRKWSVQVPELLRYVLMFKNLQNSFTWCMEFIWNEA